MRTQLLLLATFLTYSLLVAEDYPLRKAIECTPRGGVPNFLSKIESGEAVTIAYLGGSITAAPGWRILSREWFASKYPQSEFSEVHAAIGGTGSNLGVFRMQQDVLRHNPDLLFVEFAVNDGGSPPSQIMKAMEGIVRKAKKSDPELDICFVYTVRDTMLSDLQSGKMPRAASVMEEIADHYAVPSIHFGVRVASLEKQGKLVFKAPKPFAGDEIHFSTDGVHPLIETGHPLYVEAIARSWPLLTVASNEQISPPLPAPLREDNWEAAKLVPIRTEMLRGNWQRLPADHPIQKRFSRNMPEIYVANSPGAALECSFEGSSFAVFDIMGPDGGILEVELNEEPAKQIKRIDGYCTYHRMNQLRVGNDLPHRRHSVAVTLSAEKLDKRSILFEKNQNFFDKNPEKYHDSVWYVGSLMVIGEILATD